MSKVCEKCHTYKNVGEKCWYFWEEKKTCSQFKKTIDDEPKYESSEEPASQLH